MRGSRRNSLPRSKAESYLGFAKRAGRLTLGVNAVAAVPQDVYLLIADRGTAKNSRKEILKLKRKFGCPLVMAEGLETLVGKPDCKLAGVRDKNLAEAILREVGNGQITEYCGGMEE